MQQGECAAVFGATGGIGRALVKKLAEDGWRVAAGSRGGDAIAGASDAFRFDLTDEASIAAAAQGLADDAPRLVIIATGRLTLENGMRPEKSYRQLDPEAMARAFAVNTTGPALVAKHMLPLLPRSGRSVLAMIGARVGSIGDNRLGGWHAYRASKAALAMLIRNFAIEMARTHPEVVIAGLHPGTVATTLSAPFRTEGGVGILSPAESAHHMVSVLGQLGPEDSGAVFDWRGERVPA